MKRPSLDEILDCPALPTLPSVAVSVLELTKNDDVRIDDIASVVQNDPALTAKLLRTVNSSYYALAEPCLTVSRAVTYLGLSTVRSLVLSFSLIELGKGRNAVDLGAFWGRCLYAAAASRRVARACRFGDPEEAFVSGLMQDVGMLAIHAAARDSYAAVLREADGDHRLLCAVERSVLGFDHPVVGGALAERWGLPLDLVGAIRHHHDTEAASHGRLSRLVALGTVAATSLTHRDPAAAMTQVYLLANGWFGCRRSDVTQLMKSIMGDAQEMASLFEVKSSRLPDIDDILEAAEERLRELGETEPAGSASTDKVRTAEAIGDVLHASFEQARTFNGSLGVINLSVDGLEDLVVARGSDVRKPVRAAIEARLLEELRDGEQLCRDDEYFVVLLGGAGVREAATRAEAIRHAVSAQPIPRMADDAGNPLVLTCSIGVAARTPETADVIESPGLLLEAAARARRAARADGGDATRVFTPGRKAA